jgi:hypothetical protein
MVQESVNNLSDFLQHCRIQASPFPSKALLEKLTMVVIVQGMPPAVNY